MRLATPALVLALAALPLHDRGPAPLPVCGATDQTRLDGFDAVKLHLADVGRDSTFRLTDLHVPLVAREQRIVVLAGWPAAAVWEYRQAGEDLDLHWCTGPVVRGPASIDVRVELKPACVTGEKFAVYWSGTKTPDRDGRDERNKHDD